jgi:hypothetical protein
LNPFSSGKEFFYWRGAMRGVKNNPQRQGPPSELAEVRAKIVALLGKIIV